VHEPALANRSEQEGESEIEAKNACAKVTIGERYRVSGTKGDILIEAAILAKGDLAFGATIKVIEDGIGQTALCDGPEISDADDARRSDGTGRSSHLFLYYQGGEFVNREFLFDPQNSCHCLPQSLFASM
jgi:hypothetical protein